MRGRGFHHLDCLGLLGAVNPILTQRRLLSDPLNSVYFLHQPHFVSLLVVWAAFIKCLRGIEASFGSPSTFILQRRTRRQRVRDFPRATPLKGSEAGFELRASGLRAQGVSALSRLAASGSGYSGVKVADSPPIGLARFSPSGH